MTNDQIKAIALASGFTIKDGFLDLKPYVYDFANKIAAQVWREYEPHAAKDEQTIAALRATVSEQASEIVNLRRAITGACEILNKEAING